ncbi:hypothetical protein JCM19047_2501 [Bacillus sp. JCM 19047]|nr:hypothetical protein JCM19047_2501 [Bacillus sp. JCM 19047]
MTKLNIVKDFIPKSNGNRPGYAMTPKYITIHLTGNTSPGADAAMHARFVKNPSTAASWHYTNDDGSTVYQHLPTNENGWHCGDGGSGTGNRQSIGIEGCVNSDGNYIKMIENLAQLTRQVMAEHNIPIENVKQHWDWSRKNCPREIRAGKDGITWDVFIGMVKRSSEGSNSKPTPKPAPAKPSTGGSGGGSIVNWMNAQSMDSSFANRAKLAAQHGISNYSGTAAQNTQLLSLLQGGTTPKPAPPVTKPKEYVTLPASAQTWRTYKTNVAPVAKNSDWSLTPAKFGGLTYEVLARPQTDVVTINTSRGRRNIYVARSTGATFARR